MIIAALYIDEHGPYPKMPGVDAWGMTRDARTYDGPHPVVAHPPCGPWGAFAHMCKSPEQDPALAIRAVEQVRRWGGVLEHPRRSRLWAHVGLPAPGGPADAYGGRTIEVDQVEWGHAAHKRTWLYLVRVPDDAIEDPPFPGRQPTHDLMGGAWPKCEGRSRRQDGGQQGKAAANAATVRRLPRTTGQGDAS